MAHEASAVGTNQPGAADAVDARSLNLFKHIVENSDEEVLLIHTDGRIAYANPAARRNLGYTAEEFEHLSLAQIDPERGSNFTHRLANLRLQPQPTIETQHTTHDGRLIPKEVHAFIIKAGDEEYVCAFARDISARKRLEAEHCRLQEANQHAHTIEAISRLAGGIAHDFNNLLTSIRGYAELVLMLPDPPAGLTADVTEIKSAADKAAELTEQLLAFGRRQLLTPELLDLNAVLNNAAPMLKKLLGNEIQLTVETGTELGNLRADPHRIEQILVALLNNSREAMPNGGRVLLKTHRKTLRDVSTAPSGCRPGDYVVLSVTDTGCGMDAETLAHIFEPFFTTKERDRATGLSLPAVYGIVQQHGAVIEVTSERAQGTTFTLYFPAVSDVTPKPVVSPMSASTHRQGNILLVEDEESVQRLAARVLRDAGYQVLTANDAEAAMQVAAGFDDRIDLLVTDVIMPGINGRDLAETLQRRRPSMRVLYMSGYTEDILADRGIAGTDLNFIMKPFGLHEFRAKIESLLEENSRCNA